LTLILLGLRWADIFGYCYDSDETQHLHVVWGWTRDLVQYRDLFDNHMPLFHLAFAPVMGLVGAHSMTVTWMRVAQFPIFRYQIYFDWALFLIEGGFCMMILPPAGATLLTERVCRQSLGVWLVSLIELLQGRLSSRRALRAGLIFGFAIGVSLKSSLLLANLLVAALLTLSFSAWKCPGEWRRVCRFAAAFGFGALLVPGTIAVAFAAAGDWSRFYYCVLHNLLPHFHAQHRQPWWNLVFPARSQCWWPDALQRATSDPAFRLAPGLPPLRGRSELGQFYGFC
jgi:hypothetical protein